MTMSTRIAATGNGLIRRVAKPIHLYNNPASRPLVSFAGSLATNRLVDVVEVGEVSAESTASSGAGNQKNSEVAVEDTALR